MKKYSRTQIIKMFSTFSLPSSPPLSMNDSCSVLLQGPMSFPEHWLGPRPTRLQQETPAQQCRPNLILLYNEDGTEGACFLSAELIHPNECHHRFGIGEWRTVENLWTCFHSKKHLPKSFKYLLGLQCTLLCINSWVVICHSQRYRCDI